MRYRLESLVSKFRIGFCQLCICIWCSTISIAAYGSADSINNQTLEYNFAAYQQNKISSDVWLQPYFSAAKQRPIGTGRGYKATTTGFLLGYQKDVTNSTKLGLAAGYAHSVQKSLVLSQNHININNYIGMFYGINKLPYSLRLDWALSGGHNYYDGSRLIQTTPNYIIATSHYIGKQYVLRATLTKRFSYQALDLIPQINANYMYARVPQYTETSAGSLSNTVPETDSAQYTVGAGIQVEWPTLKDQRTLVSELHAIGYYVSNLQHFNLLSSSVIGGPALTTSTTTYRTTSRLGASVKLYTNKHISFKGEYDLQLKDSYYNNIFFIIARYLF